MWYPPEGLGFADAVISGSRPYCDPEMEVPMTIVRLIQECWADEPEARPVFSDVLRLCEQEQDVFSSRMSVEAAPVLPPPRLLPRATRAMTPL